MSMIDFLLNEGRLGMVKPLSVLSEFQTSLKQYQFPISLSIFS